MRIEPPPSLPWAAGARPAATAAAAPPLDPPGVRAVSQGLRQGPFSSDSVTAVRPELGRVRLPDHDEAGVLQPADDGRVEVGHVVGERPRGEGRPDPGRLVQILDRQRHAAERPVGQLGSRRRPRLLGADGDEGVQLGVEPLDPAEVQLDQLRGGDLAAPDEIGLLDRRQEGELVHSVRSSIATAITGPAGGRRAYCGYLAASSSTARRSSTIRAVPRKRTHQRRDQSSS